MTEKEKKDLFKQKEDIYQDDDLLYLFEQETKFREDKQSALRIRRSIDKKVEPWGFDNRLPQLWYKLGRRNDLIKAVQAKKVKVATCGGWEFVQKDANGKYVEVHTPDIEAFEEKVNLGQYFASAFANLYWFGMFIPEFLVNKGKIQGVGIIETPFFRFGVQDDYGYLNCGYLHSTWGGWCNMSFAQKMDILDPYSNFADNSAQIDRFGKGKFLMPSMILSLNTESVYPDPTWVSLLNTWYEYAMDIPNFKKSYRKNALNVKNIAYIDDMVWRMIYGAEWDRMGATAQNTAKKELQTQIEERLTSSSKAGNSIISFSKTSHGQINKAITIEQIEKKMPDDGAFIEDVEIANLQMLIALEFMESLLGNSIGKNGMGDNLGGAIRETLNFYLMTIRNDLDMVCEPLNFFLKFNGINAKIRFKQPYMQTLEDVTPSKRQNTPKDETAD